MRKKTPNKQKKENQREQLRKEGILEGERNRCILVTHLQISSSNLACLLSTVLRALRAYAMGAKEDGSVESINVLGALHHL